jgi:hypothetical protein
MSYGALRALDLVPLAALPKVERLTLATVTAVPKIAPGARDVRALPGARLGDPPP